MKHIKSQKLTDKLDYFLNYPKFDPHGEPIPTKNGIIHTIIGKCSFKKSKLIDNCQSIMSAILKARPSSLKGVYLKRITLSSTMGPGIMLDKNIFTN